MFDSSELEAAGSILRRPKKRCVLALARDRFDLHRRKGSVHSHLQCRGHQSASAECQSVLGLVATGDCSIATAAKKGGITRIHHADFESRASLEFAKFTVTVYGE